MNRNDVFSSVLIFFFFFQMNLCWELKDINKVIKLLVWTTYKKQQQQPTNRQKKNKYSIYTNKSLLIRKLFKLFFFLLKLLTTLNLFVPSPLISICVKQKQYWQMELYNITTSYITHIYKFTPTHPFLLYVKFQDIYKTVYLNDNAVDITSRVNFSGFDFQSANLGHQVAEVGYFYFFFEFSRYSKFSNVCNFSQKKNVLPQPSYV